MRIIILIVTFIIFTGYNGCNIFSEVTSPYWNDWENWSKGRTPYIGEDVELSPGNFVILFNPGYTTVIGKLNITIGCIFSVYSKLTTQDTITIVGTIIIFDNINVANFDINCELIWIMNNANINVSRYIILNNNDSIIVGPDNSELFDRIYFESDISIRESQNMSNIFGTVINNSGHLIILQNTKLYIETYLQALSGVLHLHYNSTVTDIGCLYGNSLSVLGKIILICEMKINVEHICVPIISGIQKTHIFIPITDNCGYMKYYSIINNTISACF